MMPVQRLLEGNKRFREKTDIGELERHVKGQTPFIIIAASCSDSRAPVGIVSDAGLGTLFGGPRNPGNIVHPAGKELNATLAYGIKHLKVVDVGIFGHYFCGGIHGLDKLGHLQKHEKELYRHLKEALPAKKFVEKNFTAEVYAGKMGWLHPKTQSEKEGFEEAKHCAIVEANVLLQMFRLKSNPLIRKNRGKVRIHGFVYDLSDGMLHNGFPTLSKLGLLNAAKKEFAVYSRP